MVRSPPGVALTAELAAYVVSGVSVVVGTRDAQLAPEITRAWGPRVSRDRRSLSVCVALAGTGRTLDNLRDNGRLAVTFALPTNYKSIQLWGHCLGTGEPNREDLAALAEHRDAFARLNETMGVPRIAIETFWKRELQESPAMIKIRFRAEQIFDQTPGPRAGSPL